MTCGKPHAEYVGQLQFATQLAAGQGDAAPRCRNPKCNLPLKKEGTCPRGCRQEDAAAAVAPCRDVGDAAPGAGLLAESEWRAVALLAADQTEEEVAGQLGRPLVETVGLLAGAAQRVGFRDPGDLAHWVGVTAEENGWTLSYAAEHLAPPHPLAFAGDFQPEPAMLQQLSPHVAEHVAREHAAIHNLLTAKPGPDQPDLAAPVAYSLRLASEVACFGYTGAGLTEDFSLALVVREGRRVTQFVLDLKTGQIRSPATRRFGTADQARAEIRRTRQRGARFYCLQCGRYFRRAPLPDGVCGYCKGTDPQAPEDCWAPW